jgi:Tol biopolymer transport system component
VADRRRRRETPVETLPDAVGREGAQADGADLASVVDEEIARLPEALRAAVVLCELEGCSRRDAAAHLGVPEGTVSSRLAAARKALAARLRNRGIALGAAGLSAVLGTRVTASVSAGLTRRAIGSALSPNNVPAAVAALSHGVLRVMFAQKLKVVGAVAALTVCAIACAVYAADRPPQTSPPVPTPPPVAFVPPAPEPVRARAEPKPLPQGPNKILFYRAGHLTLIDPDGKNEKQVSKDRGKFHPGDSRLSPDGKKVATLIQVTEPGNVTANRDPERQLYVRGLDEKEPGTDMGIRCQLFFWSPDGTQIACTDFVDGRDKKLVSVHHIIDVKTKEKTALKLAENHIITDWSRDGKLFVTTSISDPAPGDKFAQMKLHLMNRDGTEHKALTDDKKPTAFGRLSPDGKRVLFAQMEMGKKDEPPTRTLAVLEVATGKVAPVEDLPLNGEIQAYCWAPDGKKIAYSWREVHKGKPEEVAKKETESFLVVCDPDGKNAKTIATEKGEGQWTITIGHIDWR